MSCNCGAPGAAAVTDPPAVRAIAALRAQGCPCPLGYDERLGRVVTIAASRAQLSRCPYHGLAPMAERLAASARKG